MVIDKKNLFEIIRVMEKVSQKFEKEITYLKKKVNYSDLTIGIEDCYKKFYERALKPIFMKKIEITKEEIEKFVELRNLKYAKNTITCYLSNLSKNNILRMKPDQNDRRKKLYMKNIELESIL